MMTSSHPELVRQLKSEVDKVVERWAQNVLARASPAQETATEAEATATIAALLEQKDKLQEEVDVKAAHIAALEPRALRQDDEGSSVKTWPKANTILHANDASPRTLRSPPCAGPAPGRMEKGG